MSEWGSTGINEMTLGIRRSEDPVGYRKAYMMAYAAKNKKPPATFLTADQKREKYLLCLHLGNVKRREAAAAKKLTPEWTQKKADRSKAYQDRARPKRLVKAAKDRLENPEKYHERRVKKVKWVSWHEFKPLYAEARRLTLETGEQWDVEHIYPIKSNWVCGLHTPDNLRVAVARENTRKSNRPFGPVGPELWDCQHYSVYWPGEVKTLAEKREEHMRPYELAKRVQRAEVRLEEARAHQRRRICELKARVKKPRGRKPMCVEKAKLMPFVQALLGGSSLREVVRDFGVNAVRASKYVRLVDPLWKSPFAKHGRPQPTANS